MQARLATSLAVMLVLGGCYDTGDASGNAAPSPTVHVANVLIDTGSDSVLVKAEVADTPEERSRGLSHRRSLPEDGGMLFVFFERSTAGFWMKDTLIPLSVAFFDADGEIVGIRDMAPCRKEPCPVYRPPKPYWGALEVNRGAFEEWGVDVGDSINTNV